MSTNGTMKTDHHPQGQEDHPKNDSTTSKVGGTIKQKKDKDIELFCDDDDDQNIKWETVPILDDDTHQQRRNASTTTTTSRGRHRQTQQRQQQRRRRHVSVQQQQQSKPQRRLDLTSPISITIRFLKHGLHQFYTNPYFMLGYVLLLSGLCVNVLSTVWMCMSWMYTMIFHPRVWLFCWIPVITTWCCSSIYFLIHHKQTTQRNDDTTTQSLLLNSSDNPSMMVRHSHNNNQNRRMVVASSSSSSSTATTTTTATTSLPLTTKNTHNIDDVLVKCIHLVGGILYLLPILLDIHTLWIVRDTICRGLDPCQLIIYIGIMCLYLFWSKIFGAGAGAEAPSIVVLWSQQVKQCQLLLHILALHGAFQWLRRSSSSSDSDDNDDITTTLWNILHVVALVLIFVGSCLISIRHWYVVCFEEHHNHNDYVVSYLSKEEWMTECVRYGVRMTLRDILMEISEEQKEYLQTLGAATAADDIEMDQSVLLELAMLRWIVDYWGHTTTNTRGRRSSARSSTTNSTTTSAAADKNAEHSSLFHHRDDNDDDDVALQSQQHEENINDNDDDAFGWDEMRAMLSTTTDIMTREEETCSQNSHHEQGSNKWIPTTNTSADKSSATTTNPTSGSDRTNNIPQNNSKPKNDQPPQQEQQSQQLSSFHSSTLFTQMLSSLDNVDEHARPAIMTYKHLVEQKLLPRRDVAIAIKFISHIPATLSLCLFGFMGANLTSLWFLVGGIIVLMPLCVLEWYTLNQWMEETCRCQHEHCHPTVVDNDPFTTNNNEDEDDSVSSGSTTMNKLWSTTLLHDIISLVCPSFDYDMIYHQMDVMSILFTSVVVRKVNQKQTVVNDTNGTSTTRQQQRGQPQQTLVQLHLKRHTLFNVYRNLQYSVRALEGGLMVTRAIQTTALAMEFANSLLTLSHLTKEVYEYGWFHGLSLVLREYVYYRTSEEHQRTMLIGHHQQHHPFHRSSTSSLFNENNVQSQPQQKIPLLLEEGPTATKTKDDVKECLTLPNNITSVPSSTEEENAITAQSTNTTVKPFVDETATVSQDHDSEQQAKNTTTKDSTDATSSNASTTLVIVPPATATTPMAQPGEYAMAAQSAIQHGTSLMNNVQKLHEEHPHIWNTVVKASEPVGNVALSAVGRGWLWGKEEDDTNVAAKGNTINDVGKNDDTTAAATAKTVDDDDDAKETMAKGDLNDEDENAEVLGAKGSRTIEQETHTGEPTFAVLVANVKSSNDTTTTKSKDEEQNMAARRSSNKDGDDVDDDDVDDTLSPTTVNDEAATTTETTIKKEADVITSTRESTRNTTSTDEEGTKMTTITMKPNDSPSITKDIGHTTGGTVSLMMKVVASTITRSSSAGATTTTDEENDNTKMKDGITISNETHFEANKHKVSSSLEEEDALALPQTMLLVPTNETLDRYIVNEKDTDMVYNPRCHTKKMAVNNAFTSTCTDTNNEHQKTNDKKETISSTPQAKKQDATTEEDDEDKWMYIDHKQGGLVGTSSSASHHSIFSSSDDEEESLLYEDDELGDDDDNWLTLSTPAGASTSTPSSSNNNSSNNTKQHAVIVDDGATRSSSTSPHLSALSMASRLLSNATAHSTTRTAATASHRGRGTMTAERDHRGSSGGSTSTTSNNNNSNAEWSKWVGGGLAVVGAALAGAVSIHGKFVEEERLATQHQMLGDGVQIEELPNDDVVDDDDGTGTVVVRRSTKANQDDAGTKNTTNN